MLSSQHAATSPAERDQKLPLGSRIARWVVREPIGSGGHATVYRATHEELGHDAAIKVLHLERCGGAVDEMLARFRREARIAARIRHRNLVRVFDFGELDDGSPYFVMQLVRGEDLQSRIDRQGALPIAAALDVAQQTLAGLSALADHGVVHRDVKPGNLMLAPRAHGGYAVRLVDFGIASGGDCGDGRRFTIEGTVLGTPEYMSPEQIRGLPLDCRADVYSVGVVLYELLCGRLPFQGKGPCATLAMALTQQPRPPTDWRPDCPETLEAIVLRALAKDPADRFATPRAMAGALAAVARVLELPQGAAAWAQADEEDPGVPEGGLDELRSDDDAYEAGGVQRDRSAGSVRRPAARARRVFPRPVDPTAARALAEEIDLDALERDVDLLPAASTLRLRAEPRAPQRSAARIAAALLGLGVATAIGFRLASPIVLDAIAGVEIEGGAVQTQIVPVRPPPR